MVLELVFGCNKVAFQIPANHIKVLDPAVGVLNNKPALRVRDSYLKGLRGEWDALLGDDTASVTTEMLKGIPRGQSPLLPYQYRHEKSNGLILVGSTN